MYQTKARAQSGSRERGAKENGSAARHRGTDSERGFQGNQAALRRMPQTPFPIQCKLAVGATNDPLETEADQVADRVMRMADPGTATSLPFLNVRPAVVQRQCAECNEEDKVQKKPVGAAAGEVAAPPIVHDVLNGPGQSLDPATRAYFEPRFRADFGDVCVHTGVNAAESAREIGALAYAHGRNIAFADGRYEANTAAGRRLLAHELAHTLQQRQGAVRREQDPSAPVPLQGQPPKIPVARPSSAALWSAYQKVNYETLKTADEVWKLVGGSVGMAFHTSDSCATRVSYALDYGGFPIPTANNKTSYFNNPGVVYQGKAGDGMKYIVGAPDMRAFLASSFGPPDTVLTTGKEANALDDSLAKGQVAIFAGDGHAGMFYNTDYYDPYVGHKLPVSVWKMA